MVEINTDLQSDDKEDWDVATVRLMRAAIKNGDQMLIDGVRSRIVERHGELLGPKVVIHLENFIIREMMEELLKRNSDNLDGPVAQR